MPTCSIIVWFVHCITCHYRTRVHTVHVWKSTGRKGKRKRRKRKENRRGTKSKSLSTRIFILFCVECRHLHRERAVPRLCSGADGIDSVYTGVPKNSRSQGPKCNTGNGGIARTWHPPTHTRDLQSTRQSQLQLQSIVNSQ